jgi:hypothetical protein
MIGLFIGAFQWGFILGGTTQLVREVIHAQSGVDLEGWVKENRERVKQKIREAMADEPKAA